MKQRILIAPLAATLAFLLVCWTACSKSSSSSDNSNRVTLVTKAAWKYDTAGIDLDRNGTIEIGDTTLQACYKDNTYLFNKDSTGVADEGATKCSSTDPQTTAFTWSFSGTNQSKITSTADPLLAQGVNIYSLTDTKFVLYKDTTVLGVNIWYIISLKH